MSSRAAFLAIAAVALALLVGLFVASLEGGPGISDTPVYQVYGDRIEDGRVPYRDFTVEYPPLALVPFALPSLLSSTADGYDCGLPGADDLRLRRLHACCSSSPSTRSAPRRGASSGRSAPSGRGSRCSGRS